MLPWFGIAIARLRCCDKTKTVGWGGGQQRNVFQRNEVLPQKGEKRTLCKSWGRHFVYKSAEHQSSAVAGSDLLRQQALPHMPLPQVSWHVRMALTRWLAGRWRRLEGFCPAFKSSCT